VDAHFEHATGNGHVAASSGPSTGSMQGYAEASTAQSVQDAVYVVARSQPLYACAIYGHGARSSEPATRSVGVLCTHEDAVSAHGIFASASWANDAHADDSSSSDYCYDHSHTIFRSICSADDWFTRRVPVFVHRFRGIHTSSWIRSSCISPVPCQLDTRGSEGSWDIRLS